MVIFLAFGYIILKSVAVEKEMAYIWERRPRMRNKLKLQFRTGSSEKKEKMRIMSHW